MYKTNTFCVSLRQNILTGEREAQQMKDYKTMTEQEKAQWVVQFSQFLVEDYLKIKVQADGWREAFDRGLQLMESMPSCKRFVRESRTYGDYHRRIKLMGFFVEQLRKEVIEVDGKVLTQMVQPEKRRRGRPTLLQQAQEAERRRLIANGKLEAIEVIAGKPQPKQAEIFDNLTENREGTMARNTGKNTSELHGEKNGEKQEKPRGKAKGTKAAAVQEPCGNAQGTADAQGTKAYRLQDIKHLLSGDLQVDVDRIAVLRSEAAAESEKAKELAEKGEIEAVPEHTQKAIKLTEEYEDIYRRMDEELAKVYIRVRVNKEKVTHYGKREDVMRMTDYYYHKVVQANSDFEAKFLSKLAKDAEKSLRTWDEKHELRNIRDYFYRKDVKLSESRLEGMKKRIKRAKELGYDTTEYEVILKEAKKQLK